MMKRESLNRLQLIISVLRKDVERELVSLNKIKAAIAVKSASINKMIAYRNEYMSTGRLTNANLSPALMSNMENFIEKLNRAINSEKVTVNGFDIERVAIVNRVNNIESKISVLEDKCKKIQSEIHRNAYNEQIENMNEMAVYSGWGKEDDRS